MKKKYYKKFDYIRVTACIAVLLYHTGLLKGGYLAVCTFFVLSGYLSTASLLRKQTFSAKEYYLNRLKRIYLPLVITVFSSIAVVSLFRNIPWVNLKPETTSVLLGYNNYWQLNADLDYFTRHVESPFTHLWYIAILMQFDLVWPWICLMLKNGGEKNRILPLSILGAGITASYIFFCIRAAQGFLMGAYYDTLCRLFSLLAGALLAFMHQKSAPMVIIKREIRDIMFPVYLGILCVMFLLTGSEGIPMTAGMLVTTLISMRLISYGMTASSRKRPSDVLLGKLSGMTYEIYLVQYPVIFLMQKTGLNSFITVPLILILTFVSAYVLKKADDIRMPSMKDISQVIITGLTAAVCFCGMFTYAVTDDHAEEMKELEDKLAENEKLTEEKNQNYDASAQPETTAPAEEETAEEETTEETVSQSVVEKTDQMMKTMPVVGVGDSILLDVVDRMYEYFPNGYFDCKISRNLTAGTEILKALKDEGKLADTVILSLAENGDFAVWTCQALMDVVGDREVFWINAVGGDDPNMNAGFSEFAKDYPNIHIIDWVSVAAEHPEYLYPDGIHVAPEGYEGYTDLITSTVYNVYLEKNKAAE